MEKESRWGEGGGGDTREEPRGRRGSEPVRVWGWACVCGGGIRWGGGGGRGWSQNASGVFEKSSFLFFV
jgi:hypothetical protein